MRTLLLSAFGRFGEHRSNTSEQVLRELKDVEGGLRIAKVLLPVLYRDSFLLLREHIQKENPDMVICLGMAGGRDRICLEQFALNIANSNMPDNQGIILRDTAIDPEGPPACCSTLPLIGMRDAARGGLADISYCAGTYVCNDLFYRLMRFLTLERPWIQGGFVHLSYETGSGNTPALERISQVLCLRNMIQFLGESGTETSTHPGIR